MTETVQTITEYLEGYEKTYSNQMDSKFNLFKSDVYSLAKDLEEGELYIYSKDEYIEFLEEIIQESLEEETDFAERLLEVKESNATVFLEISGSDTYYAI